MTSISQATVSMMAALKRQRGLPAVYHRANGHEVSLTLCPARKNNFVQSQAGRTIIATNDYLVLAADLYDTEEAAQFLPERGEGITITLPDSSTAEYEVLPDTGLPHYEYLDSTRVALRIRTLALTP